MATRTWFSSFRFLLVSSSHFLLLPLPDLSTIDLITRRLRQPIATPSTVPWTRRHRHRTLPTRRSSSSKGGRQEQHRRMDHRWSLQEGQRGRRARQPIMDKDRQRHHQDEDPLSRWNIYYIWSENWAEVAKKLRRSSSLLQTVEQESPLHKKSENRIILEHHLKFGNMRLVRGT